MDLLVPLQHPDELLDPPGAGLRLLRGLNPEEDRVRDQKIFRYGGTLRRMVGVLPPPVPLRVLDRPQPGRHHPSARGETDVRALPFFAIINQTPCEDS